ncbi:MAG: glycosyltransferase family 39 protein [Bryobacteraceae bacterium]
MIVVLPAALLALAYAFADSSGWRAALLRALVAFGTATVMLTEALSLFHAIHLIAYAWAAVIALAAATGWKRQAAGASWQWPGWLNAGIIAASFLITVTVMIIAVVSAPNSTDAMAYHLPRVIYWVQADSVAFFATPYLNQIMLQPLAEYVMLHTYLLSGGDSFVNLVQWMASAGSIVGVSLIARSLSAGIRGQALAGLFCATLPNGILQASGAKNDYVLALWLVALIWLGLEWEVRRRFSDLLLLGLAVGLALFTKGTAYLFVPPFLAAFIWQARRHLPRFAAIVCGCLVLINGPFYLRNLDLSGSPLGFDSAQGDGVYRWRNEKPGWRATVSNLSRNASEQLGFRSEANNRRIWQAVLYLHHVLGIDPNDPGTTWPGSTYEPPRNSNHEANANNFWHLLLLAAAAPFLLWKRTRAAWLIPAAAAGFALFCFYLKWQPFQARLLLPLFVASAPAAGIALQAIPSAVLQAAVCLFLLGGARLPVLQNWVRPLTGPNSIFLTSRESQYFADLTLWNNKKSYLDVVAAVKGTGCRTVGIDGNRNQIEYPIQVLLLRSDPGYRFKHIEVRNASRRYVTKLPAPCIAVSADPSGQFRILSAAPTPNE